MRVIMMALVSLVATTAMLIMAASSTGEIKDGCLQKCGNITIPYPFGTTNECHLSGQLTFFITCNTTFDPPKPFLSDGNLEVTNISLQGEIDILGPVAFTCYNDDYNGSVERKTRATLRFTLPGGGKTNFTIPPRRNKFMAMGCDTAAVLRSWLKLDGVIAEKFSSGCNSFCLGSSDHGHWTGCCHTPIPRRLSFAQIDLISNDNQTNNVSDRNMCSYGFVTRNDFEFKTEYLGEFTQKTVPVVLDWAIGNQTCEVAALDQTTLVCKANANCFDRSDEGILGYLCKCKDGYQGNPYLEHPHHGCTDINECSDPGLNNCQSICINVPGSYTCRCPNGYHGDGRKNGSGCIKTFSLVIVIAVGSSIALGLLLLLLGTWWFAKVLRRRRDAKKRQELFKKNGGILLQQRLLSKEGSFEKTKIFTVFELEIATDKFNENRIIGRGEQGTVYKGMLEDGTIVAVKKSKVVSTEQLEQFINEFVILSQIHHRNVVKLLGCCLETEIPLLVYEFISGGTLFQLIHDETEESSPSWEMRLRVAAEVAGAIAYLHAYASTPVFHRDIKTSNILLDEKLRAKLSDFGISKSVDIDQTHITTEVRGTFGYCDPEYFRSNQFTEKSDVYSFGVVLAELITGKKPISAFSPLEEFKGLVVHFISSMENGRLFEILDKRVAAEAAHWQVVVISELVKRCLDSERNNRPPMKEIARELDKIISGMKEEEGKSLVLLRTQESLELEPSRSSYLFDSATTSCIREETKPLMFHTR